MIQLLPVVVFVVLLVSGVPIAFGMALVTLVALGITIDFVPNITTVAQRTVGGLDSFALLAIPLFILSGLLMGQGGIAKRLIHFARCLVGAVPGGLAFVNVLSCTLFGAIAGSSVAANTAVGSVMTPEMERAGFSRAFGGALTGAASTTGLIIPPSNIMIVYAVAAGGVSIGAIFLGGYLPGLLVSALLMVACYVHAKRHKLPATGRVPLAEALRAGLAALPSLFLIVLVIGGILAGIFTATEAGAIAVLYAWFLSSAVYREVSLRELYPILLRSAETTAIVMLSIATSVALSWVLALHHMPEIVASFMLGLTENPLLTLLIINVVLLAVGTFMDMTPAVLIFTPIFLPVALDLGMSPEHFGIMIILNLAIGLITPPVGSVLFLSAAIAQVSIGKISRALIPIYVAMTAALLIVTYVPALSELLPRQFGLMD